MPAFVNPDECTGCESCIEACPTEAIAMTGDGVAKVDPDTCTDCEACLEACPTEAITMAD
ncbi:MAG: 4Fe-4S binding protein [bacterium]|jgi:Na+-translocating ferredoxin:NAD+ oxidoreductase RNF subunit RnfB|nr:ferredoxin [Gemmatimonas sp.]MDO9171000.1 4Fe-4S binding protein [bacterium]